MFEGSAFVMGGTSGGEQDMCEYLRLLNFPKIHDALRAPYSGALTSATKIA